jgi:DNA-binding NarL/FixJ family response regulator
MLPITVAIVEDLDEVREGLVNFINFDPELKVVASFGTAEEAFEAIVKNQPNVVVMDINLPGMSGIRFIEEIRDTCPATRFMMFTVYENDDKVFEALNHLRIYIMADRR